MGFCIENTICCNFNSYTLKNMKNSFKKLFTSYHGCLSPRKIIAPYSLRKRNVLFLKRIMILRRYHRNYLDKYVMHIIILKRFLRRYGNNSIKVSFWSILCLFYIISRRYPIFQLYILYKLSNKFCKVKLFARFMLPVLAFFFLVSFRQQSCFVYEIVPFLHKHFSRIHNPVRIQQAFDIFHDLYSSRADFFR